MDNIKVILIRSSSDVYCYGGWINKAKAIASGAYLEDGYNRPTTYGITGKSIENDPSGFFQFYDSYDYSYNMQSGGLVINGKFGKNMYRNNNGYTDLYCKVKEVEWKKV